MKKETKKKENVNHSVMSSYCHPISIPRLIYEQREYCQFSAPGRPRSMFQSLMMDNRGKCVRRHSDSRSLIIHGGLRYFFWPEQLVEDS